jgi:hypothetical protein
VAALSGPERAQIAQDYTEYRIVGLTDYGAARMVLARLLIGRAELTDEELAALDAVCREAEKEFGERKENVASRQNSQERLPRKEAGA